MKRPNSCTNLKKAIIGYAKDFDATRLNRDMMEPKDLILTHYLGDISYCKNKNYCYKNVKVMQFCS